MNLQIEFMEKAVNKVKEIYNMLKEKIKFTTADEKNSTTGKETSPKEKISKSPQDKKTMQQTKPQSKKATSKKPSPKKEEKQPEANINDVLRVVVKYEKGIKQTELYKELITFNKEKLSLLLAKMDKDKKIRREKIGTSYIIFRS